MRGVGRAAVIVDDHPGFRAVIVDDHPGFRAALRRLLEAGDYTVVAEESCGEDALEAVALLRPQLAVVDVVLPGMDGFAVAERVKAETDTAVVLVSSRRAADFGPRLERPGVPPLVHKGDLSAATLAAALAEAS